jgi:HK97 family phage portal protein
MPDTIHIPIMANYFQRLLQRAAGMTNIAQQLQNMQSTAQGLAAQNAYLNEQVQLSINFRNQGGFARFNNIQTQGLITNGYNMSSAVYSIVSDIAQSAASIPRKVYEVKDVKAMKMYKALKALPRSPENDYRLFHLKERALTEVDSSNRLQALIDRPNPIDSASLFYRTVVGYQLITGNSFMAAPLLDVGPNAGTPDALFIMPSQYTGIICTNTWPNMPLGYELIVNGVQLFQSNDVIHLRYPNYNYDITGLQLYGLSPLYAGRKTLATNVNGETYSDMMYVNGGPKVIIAREDMSSADMDTIQQGRAKQADKREYSGPMNANKYKVMAGKIDVHQLELSPVDMNVIASQGWTFAQICNLFHVSDIMYNNHDASTESNVKEMRRDYWTRGVIPCAQEVIDGFINKLVPLYNKKEGKKYWIELDTSGIPELQPDVVSQVSWLKDAWWVTGDEKRRYQDFDDSGDPLMKKYYIPNNLVPLEDVGVELQPLASDPSTQNLDNTAE